MLGREAFHWTPMQTGIQENVKHDNNYCIRTCIHILAFMALQKKTFKYMYCIFCTHCEIDGHHKTDLAASSDVVNKTEGGDRSTGRYKIYM